MAAILQPVSWARMERGIEKVRERLLNAAAALDAARVPYAVTDGNAVAAWVSRVDESAVRNTRDVDILLRRSDLSAAIDAMTKAGFVHRNVDSLGKGGSRDVFLDGSGTKIGDAVHVVYAKEKILPDNIQISADVDESESAGDFRLVSLQALVRMKLIAWRDKDRMHLRDLLSVGLIDFTWVEGFDGEMRQRLQHIIDSPEG